MDLPVTSEKTGKAERPVRTVKKEKPVDRKRTNLGKTADLEESMKLCGGR